jgi:hypothetical protein
MILTGKQLILQEIFDISALFIGVTLPLPNKDAQKLISVPLI